MNVVTRDVNEVENIRIIIVDDSADVRQALKNFISLTGDIDVVGEAIDGEEGLKKAAELQPDIIIMDERMPVLNGLEASRILNESTLHSKVIMLTNYEDFESEAYKCGVTAYLIKGVKLEILIDCIRKVYQSEIYPLHNSVDFG
ncbi:MAG: response regulator [Dehalococcoidales bacterium]|nr:MAG: response regulator [Dehalococcoidales bacterium]